MSSDIEQAVLLLNTALATINAHIASLDATRRDVQTALDEVRASSEALRREHAVLMAAIHDTKPLAGWKEILPILEELGRPCTERHARRLAGTRDNPLPIRYLHKRPKTTRAELREWVARDTRRGRRPEMSAVAPVVRRKQAHSMSAFVPRQGP